MVNYRQFWLANAFTGESDEEIERDGYSLSDPDAKHFLSEPQGLGFEIDYEGEQVGYSEIIVKEQIKLIDITGNVVFYDPNNAQNYQEYKEFSEFISHKPLRLYYQPPNESTKYYTDIILVEVEKGEANPQKSLVVSISMHRTSPWKRLESLTVSMKNAPTEPGKYYDAANNMLRYDYHYAAETLNDIVVYNNGSIDAPVIIEISKDPESEEPYTYIENPKFSFFDERNNRYGIIDLEGTFTFLRINSDDIYQSISLEYESSSLANPYSYQNLTNLDGSEYITFIKLKPGKNHISFSCGNITTFDGVLKISFSESRASV